MKSLVLAISILVSAQAFAENYNCMLYVPGDKSILLTDGKVFFNGTVSAEQKLFVQADGMVLPKAAKGNGYNPLISLETLPNGTIVMTESASGMKTAGKDMVVLVDTVKKVGIICGPAK